MLGKGENDIRKGRVVKERRLNGEDWQTRTGFFFFKGRTSWIRSWIRRAIQLSVFNL